MGGHGHGHEPPYRIPDYKEFSIKGIRELEELEQALAKKNLKDPWIRNEVWRYHPGWGTRLSRGLGLFFRGFPIGLGLTVVTLGLQKAFGSGDGHGHDDGEHH